MTSISTKDPDTDPSAAPNLLALPSPSLESPSQSSSSRTIPEPPDGPQLQPLPSGSSQQFPVKQLDNGATPDEEILPSKQYPPSQRPPVPAPVIDHLDGSSASPLTMPLDHRASRPLPGARPGRSTAAVSPLVRDPGGRRPSPITEENTPLSPMTAAFTDPAPSTGTESTSSSSRTLRGSLANTPAAHPVRTPSYPFPYVPGTPKAWARSIHQPFTVLSPTQGSGPAAAVTPSDQSISDDRSDITKSGHTTAAAAFLPPNTTQRAAQDSRYPTPSLYKLVLDLNAEPGLDAWWCALTRLMRDSFMAERLSLALPADSSDLENVPWGQQATYNSRGLEEPLKTRTPSTPSSGQNPPPPSMDAPRQPLPHFARARPGLSSRHSYAGHGLQPVDSAPPSRPGLHLRTVSHAPDQLPRNTPGMSRIDTSSTNPRTTCFSDGRHSSLSDADFSTIAGEHSCAPMATVFPTLRALSHETDGLIDSSGVNRLLSRGRLVTLTRDYSLETSRDFNSSMKSAADLSETTPTAASASHSKLGSSTVKPMNNFRNNLPTSDPCSKPQRRASAFEEYEQVPASPWAQSPAPSPAIQADPEVNPFFASQESFESSFDPAAPSPDYSQFTGIEAIGVDRANTVIHLPLVHPKLSPIIPETNSAAYAPSENQSIASNGDLDQRAPIAIVSLLSHAVPFPPNLVESLSLLSPHLAVSYNLAYQYTSAFNQAMGVKHARNLPGRPSGPLLISAVNLGELVHRDRVDNVTGSVSGPSGSITSSSECSGRSRHSPSSSLVGTPGWDVGMGTRSISGTPAALSRGDHDDNYFDSQKLRNVPQRLIVGVSASASATPAKLDATKGRNMALPNDEERDLKMASGKSARSPLQTLVPSQPSPRQTSDSASGSPLRAGFRTTTSFEPAADSTVHAHSVLHSYGADFTASFQSLPATSQPKQRRRDSGPAQSHLRNPSLPDTYEMPPPSERLLRTIIDSLPVQIFTASPDSGDLTWVNSKYLVYRGQDQRRVLKEPWESIYPDDRRSYMDQWDKSMRTGLQLQCKVRLQRFDGHYRWFYVRVAPLRDKRHNIVHWIGTNMDFHEQHLAEQLASTQHETAASEAKYRALADSSPQIVFTVNKTKGVMFCNTQWTNFSGQSEAAALGLGFMEQVHPDDIIKCRLPTFEDGQSKPTNVPTSVSAEPRRTFSYSQVSSDGSSETEKAPTSPLHFPPVGPMPQAKLSELASTGILKVSRDASGKPSYSTEVRLRSKDGEYRWHLVRVVIEDKALAIDEDNELWYGTCTDIDDHKALERDLKENMDEKSRFLSNMSHEIRTPLNGITGMVNFLIDSSLTVEQMEHVNIIRASTEGLRGLINDILDLSKAEAGMIQLSVDWLHVRSLIEEVNDLTSAMAIDKGLELNYLVETDVPAQIEGDRFRIRQILLNVIGNAIKFTQVGEVLVRCSVLHDSNLEHLPTELYIQFEVIDTGRGFADNEAQYLFKRFSQIDGSSTRQHGGTGLGLVISRQLAQLHGGDMAAKSTPGKGSSFIFFIKTTLPTEDNQPPSPDSSYSRPGSKSEATEAVQANQALPAYKGKHRDMSPKLLSEMTPSPASIGSAASPGMSSGSSDPSLRTAHSVKSAASPGMSSGSSDPSLRTAQSVKSERSSASSFMPDVSIQQLPASPIRLSLPNEVKSDSGETLHENLTTGAMAVPERPITVRELTPGGTLSPPMYSILVVCPLEHSREATLHHMNTTLPKSIPHQVSARASVDECIEMIAGETPVIFSHIVLVVQDVEAVTNLMEHVLTSSLHSLTQLVVITDAVQRRKIVEQASNHNFERLGLDRRVRFIFKPLKPSKFAVIFDPQKERETSTDRNQYSAQQVALDQKQTYDEMTRRLGNKERHVLLVEDNRINQMVLLKFLSKISVKVDVVQDGVQCTDKIYSQGHGYYSIVLCDLHMPNKDGYQTCREIRRWEKENKYPYVPIIALSANVLGDVWAKCVESGFNSYVTKPVDFKELSNVMLKFMDPSDPGKPIEFMKAKKK